MSNAAPITVTSRDFERIDALLGSAVGKHIPGAEALQFELDRANVIDSSDVPAGLVTMNSTVLFRDELSKQEFQLKLVYPDSGNQPHSVSILAPVGSALLGLSTGQEISWQVPGGRMLQLHVLEVRYEAETIE